MKEITLAAEVRSENGKGPARRARMEGMIPAIIYGPELDPISISVSEREFRSSMKDTKGTSIINLTVNGNENKVVLRELQRDPVTSRVLHIDFHAISMNRPINVKVPLKFVGIPIGVKTDGGIMQTIIREIDVSCLPTNIPDTIEINVEGLSISESIHVENIEIPNATILTEGNRTVVTISAPTIVKSETVEAAEEGKEGAGGAEGTPGEGDAAGESADEKKEE